MPLPAGRTFARQGLARIKAALGPVVPLVLALATATVLPACSQERSIPRDCLGRPVLPGETSAGTALLSWKTADDSGNGVSRAVGYRVYYGIARDVRPCQLEVRDATAKAIRVKSLTPGKWYFSVVGFDANAVESRHSEVVSKLVK